MPVIGTPRIGVLGLGTSGYASLIQAAGGRPVRRELLGTSPRGGVALRREWVADQAEIFGSTARLDALFVGPCRTEDLVGLLLAALRLNLPTVFAPSGSAPFDAVPYALGLAPLDARPAEVAVEVARAGGPRPRELVENFSLANALRVGLAAGGGPELLVHLAAVAREVGVVGFPQMIRVLAPESPALTDPPETTARLLSSLGDTLHDVRTVEGTLLKETLPEPTGERPAEGHRLRFVTGRASGVEAVVGVPPGVEEVAGECRVYGSEDEAIEAVREGRVGEGNLLVVAGCGPRGGPGLLRLDLLGAALASANLDVPVITDGLPPGKASGTSSWIPLFTPEAVAGGVVGRLRDDDFLRFDPEEGLIRTGVRADEILSREPLVTSAPSGFGYAARYARAALPALEGAGFGP